MTTMAWGENIQIFMELGFPVNPFTLDDAALGVLDEDYLDGTLIGDDVSPYAQEVSISRGRSDQLQNFNAGTCSVRLLNRDRRFDPINESSPYWNSTLGVSGIAPRRKVTVFSDGVALFTGRITDIDVSYEPNNPNATSENSYVTITASDDFVLLANTFTENALTPTQELSGTRVSAILDLPEVNYPATRDIDAGSATLGGGATFEIGANTNILTYLQSVATSEQGYFFVAANGDLTFTDRIAASFATPSAYFSDAGSNIPYTSLSVMYGQEFLYNKVVCTVEGGTDQTVNDVASQTEYGISTLNLSGLLLVDDAAALTLATDLLDRYKLPEYRFDKLQTIYNPLTVGNQGTLTGLEIADVVVLDDIVVPGNAYTEDGRDKVSSAYSQLASIENPGALEWVVGTRYHPKDIYDTMINMKEVHYNEAGEVELEEEVYELFQRVVETDGEYLWAKQTRADGKTFGFDSKELARIKAKYVDQTQFYAQYYNNPNSGDTARIDADKFQYYDRSVLQNKEGDWYIRDRKLNVYAAIDFAFSLRKKADYTALVVIGVDHQGRSASG